MNTWLLIMFIGGGTYGVKYVEFFTKQACEAAMVATQGVGVKSVCVEGGKPIPDIQTIPVPLK